RKAGYRPPIRRDVERRGDRGRVRRQISRAEPDEFRCSNGTGSREQQAQFGRQRSLGFAPPGHALQIAARRKVREVAHTPKELVEILVSAEYDFRPIGGNEASLTVSRSSGREQSRGVSHGDCGQVSGDQVLSVREKAERQLLDRGREKCLAARLNG